MGYIVSRVEVFPLQLTKKKKKKKRRVKNKPLKLGLIRASYPDVRPMSESRKSDGDMLEEDLESYSLASASLKQTDRQTGTRTHAHARHQMEGRG